MRRHFRQRRSLFLRKVFISIHQITIHVTNTFFITVKKRIQKQNICRNNLVFSYQNNVSHRNIFPKNTSFICLLLLLLSQFTPRALKTHLLFNFCLFRLNQLISCHRNNLLIFLLLLLSLKLYRLNHLFIL